MEPFFTLTNIFIGTVAGFLFGSVWYSPILFMNAWLKGLGINKEELPNRGKRYMASITIYSFLAHGCIAVGLAFIFDLAGVSTLYGALSLGLFLSFAFIVTTRFIDLVYTVRGAHYEMGPQINFLVTAGYYVCMTAVMSATMFLLV